VNAVRGVIEQHGGQVVTATVVKRILIKDGSATGVELADGRVEHADVILASGGMKELFYDLVGKEKLPLELINQIDSNA